jgi:hypothetical protein
LYLAKRGVLQSATPQFENLTLFNFLRLSAEQTLHFLLAATLFSSFDEHEPFYEFRIILKSVSLIRYQPSFGDVASASVAKASGSSSAQSFSSSLCANLLFADNSQE